MYNCTIFILSLEPRGYIFCLSVILGSTSLISVWRSLISSASNMILLINRRGKGLTFRGNQWKCCILTSNIQLFHLTLSIFKANTVRILIRVAVKPRCLNLGSCLQCHRWTPNLLMVARFCFASLAKSAFAALLKPASLPSGLLENFHPVSW